MLIMCLYIGGRGILIFLLERKGGNELEISNRKRVFLSSHQSKCVALFKGAKEKWGEEK